MDWWKARPTWQKVTLAAVVAFVAIGVLAPEVDEPEAEAADATTTTTVAVTTTVDATTTTEATTTTTQASTTTTTPATTTTLSLEVQRLLLVSVMNDSRLELIELFEEIFPVERVDTLNFEPGLIEMDVTTSFASLQSDPEERSDDAWGIMQGWGAYFGAFIADYDPGLVPDVVLTMNGQWVIDCPGDFMARVADRRAGQADMNQTCSGLS